MTGTCPDHARNRPVRDMQHARIAARDIAVRTPSIVPEFMWDTSHPESIACCTRGALAMSLVHAAIRSYLGERRS